MSKIVVTKRTVTVVQRVKLDDYSTTDPREAISYELQMPKSEKIEAFIETLEFSESGDVSVSEIVTVEDE